MLAFIGVEVGTSSRFGELLWVLSQSLKSRRVHHTAVYPVRRFPDHARKVAMMMHTGTARSLFTWYCTTISMYAS